MKKEQFLIPQILLEIADFFPENSRRGKYPNPPNTRNFTDPVLKRFLKKLRSQMPTYTLSNEEIALIAILFERFLDKEKKVNAIEVAERLYPDSVERLHALKIIRGLVVKGLIDTRGVNVKITGTEERTEDKFSLVKLVESEVLFREASSVDFDFISFWLLQTHQSLHRVCRNLLSVEAHGDSTRR